MKRPVVGELGNPKARTAVNAALRRKATGDYAGAIKILERSRALGELDQAGLGVLGLCLAAEERFGDAVKVLRHVVKLSPRSDAASATLFRSLFALGRERTMIREARRYVDSLGLGHDEKPSRTSLANQYRRLLRCRSREGFLARAREIF